MEDRFGTRRNAKAFTLIELIVALGIVAIVFALTISSLNGWREKNKLSIAKRQIESALKLARSKALASEDASEYGVLFADKTIEGTFGTGIQYSYTLNDYYLCKDPVENTCVATSCYVCNETEKTYELPKGVSFCPWPKGTNNTLHVDYPTVGDTNAAFPAPTFNRLTGEFGNIKTGETQGTLYIYDEDKVVTAPCLNENVADQCLLDGTCAAIRIEKSGVVEQKGHKKRFVIVADRTYDKIKIFDFTVNDNPSLVSDEIAITDPTSMVEYNGYLYIVDDAGNLTSADIRGIGGDAPSVLVSGSVIQLGNLGADITADNGFLYAVTKPGGLKIYDLSDPMSPAPRDTDIQSGDNPIAVQLVGNYAYVLDGVLDSIKIFDIGDKDNVIAYSIFPEYLLTGGNSPFADGPFTNSSPRDMVVREIAGDTIAYVLDAGAKTIAVFDFTPWMLENKPNGFDPYIGEINWNPLSVPISMSVSGNYAYIVDSDGKLSIVDISRDPSNMSADYDVYEGGVDSNIAVKDDTAYIAQTYFQSNDIFKLVAVDVSNPAAPALISGGGICVEDSYGSCSTYEAHSIIVVDYPFK